MNFHLLTNYLDLLDEEYGIKALDMIVTMNHEVVYRHMAGHADHEGKKPVSEADRYYLYSCTKVMTMTAVMQLIEQGKISLYDPIAKFLPEWAHMTVINADYDSVGPMYKPRITDPSHYTQRQVRIIDCMSMTAGLTYDMASDAIRELLEKNPEASTQEVVAAMARMPLVFEPGTRYLYSMGHDVIGAVIEAVSGERLSEYLQNHVFGPLGVTELTMHLSDKEKQHLSAMYTGDPKTGKIVPIPMSDGFRISRNFESGGGSLAGTVNGYSTVLDALANGGVGRNGSRILKEESVRMFTHSVLTGKPLDDFRKGRFLEYSYGLGVRVKVTPVGFGGWSPEGEFGWDGAAGAYAVVDPFNHISIFYVQHVLNFFQVYSEVHPRVRDLVYKGLAK